MHWWTIYDYSAARWSFPRQWTEHQAQGELYAATMRTPAGVPAPVLARWNPAGHWEYRPHLSGGYVALR